MSVSSVGSASSAYSTDWLQSILAQLSTSQSTTTTSDTASAGTGSADSSSASFASAVVSAVDTDGDGKISAEEIEDAYKSSQELLSSLDDSSAQTRAYEANQQPPPPPPPPEEMSSETISALDADGDGSLSETESGLTTEQFSSLDTDGNGSVSANELTEAFAKAGPPPPPPEMTDKASSSSSSTATSESSSEYGTLLSLLGQDLLNSSNIESVFSSASSNSTAA